MKFQNRCKLSAEILAALESSGVERVKLELQRITHTNLFTFGGVQVRRGDALDWLSAKARKDARLTQAVAITAMLAGIVAVIFSIPSWR